MMRADVKRLNEAERVWLDRHGETVDIRYAWQKSDARIALRRREQAMLAAAGMDGPEARWYVLRVEAGADIAVDKALHDANVEHHMLSIKVDAKRRGKRKYQSLEPCLAPAFPGYLFVKVVACAATWAGLRTVDGVVDVLGGGDNPHPVKEREIVKFQASIEKDPKAIALLTNALAVGDVVSVDNGPFASFEGIVMVLSEAARVKVEVDIFGRKVPVDLELAQVTKLD